MASDIVQVDITYLGFFIPLIHAVDGLSELSAATLVYAASVNPNILESIQESLITTFVQLLISALVTPSAVYHVLVQHLLSGPSMREDGVLQTADIFEMVREFSGSSVDQTHCCVPSAMMVQPVKE